MPEENLAGRSLFVIVRNREKAIFMGDAKSVSSINNKGPFDVLPAHANFISLIRDFVLIIKPDGKSQKLDVKGPAVMKVAANKVQVFFGVAAPENHTQDQPQQTGDEPESKDFKDASVTINPDR